MKTEKNNPKIVYLGRYVNGGILSGPEKAAKRIFAEYSKEKKGYFIQYFFDGNKYGIWKKFFGYEESVNKENEIIYTAGIFKIYGILKEIQPDIIHIIAFERFAVAAVIYKFFNKVKIVYNAHGVIAYENSEIKNIPFWYKLKDRFCEKRYIKNSDKIIFGSEQGLDIAEEQYTVDKSKPVILANGIDTIFLSHGQKDFNSKLKAVLFYSNKLYQSGFDFLKHFLENNEADLDIYIISNLDLRNELSQFKNINLIEVMTPEKLTEFYTDKHIYFSLNSYDTFSISTAEAMASGLVPFVTQQTGISRYIENNLNGHIFPYGDTNSLSSQLNAFFSLSAEEKSKISENAKAIYEDLNWKSVYETYKNIYSELA